MKKKEWHISKIKIIWTKNIGEESDKNKAYIDEVIELNKANRSKNKMKLSEVANNLTDSANVKANVEDNVEDNVEEDEYDLNKITKNRADYYEKLADNVDKNNNSDKTLNNSNKNLSEYDIEGASRNITLKSIHK